MSELNDLNNEVLDGTGTKTEGLPMFLNVLTILTFIGSGLALLGGIWNIMTVESSRAEIERTVGMFGESSAMEKMMEGSLKMLDNAPLLYGTQTLVAILCLVGAFMMRKLDKKGYYIYVGASIVSIIVPIAVVGFGLMGGMVLAGSVFTIAFIIMYSVNLKHLK